MRFLVLLVSWILLSGLAVAQPAPLPAPVAQPVDGASIRASLEQARTEIEQQKAGLRRPDLDESALQEARQHLDAVAERLRQVLATTTPRLDAARQRLDQLGPKPKEGAPAESPDVARDRTEREANVAEIDDVQRLSRALLTEAEQMIDETSNRRRTAFTRALFARTYSLVSPSVWASAARTFPRDLRALQMLLGDAWDRFQGRSNLAVLGTLAGALGLAIALHLVRRKIAPRLVHRPETATDPSRRQKLKSAVATLLAEALPAALGSLLIYGVLYGTDVLPPRLYPAAASFFMGLAFVAFTRALADSLIPPERPSWRLVGMGDPAASRTQVFAVSFVAVVAVGKVLDSLNQAIAAGVPLTALVQALTAFIGAIILVELLRRFATQTSQAEDCLGPYIPTDPEAGGPIRIVGWVALGLVLVSVLAGYVSFATFLTDQIVWVGTLASLLYLALPLADEFLGGTFRTETRVLSTLQANTGLRRRSLEQLGVLASGVTRVILVIVAVMLALAPWGIESGDVTSYLRAAVFGFRVGDVTISLSTIVIALLFFGTAIAATRIIQRWLDATFLPATELDSGLRNSIGTAIGYLGFFIACALAFTYLGLSLEKIAIVAGALSVGIGFGLQSIVNNFVSGLILLWERPIRVGDLVVVGDGEGYVRKISVRATEIETLDRSAVIVPNSNLISGVVKNRFREDRTGRVVLPVSVLRNQDPARAAELLVATASKHPDVVAHPPPQVMFKKIGDTWLDFDLVCVVSDATRQVRIASDLNFAIFKLLVEEKILPPLGPGAMNIGGLGNVESALGQIASAIATAGPGTERPAPDTRPSPSGG